VEDRASLAPRACFPLTRARWRERAILLLLLDLFLAQAVVAGSSLGEDAFIGLRYVENVANGVGFRFNAEDDRPCEGFSNLLWVVALAASARVGVPTVFGAQACGLICGLLTVWLLFRLGHRLRMRLPWLAPLIFALDAHTLYYTTYGLETPLFALLVCASATCVALHRASWRSRVRTFVSLALLVLARPEGIAVALAALGARWLSTPRVGGRHERRELLLLAASIAFVFGGLLLWRWLTFGSLLSAPALTKLYSWHQGEAARIAAGLRYVREFLVTNPSMIVALACSLLAMVPAGTRPAAVTAGASGAAVLAALIWAGGDAFYFTHWRLCVPALPVLSVSVAIALEKLLAVSTPRRRLAIALALAIGFQVHLPRQYTSNRYDASYALLGSTFAVGILRDPIGAWEVLATRVRENATFRVDKGLEGRVGDWLRSSVDRRTLLATGQAGKVPYYSGLPVIDLVGLASCEVARSPDPEGRVRAVRRRRPDLFLLASEDAGFFMMPELGYELARVFRSCDHRGPLGVGTYLLFARSGILPCTRGGEELRVTAGGRTWPLRRACVVELSCDRPGRPTRSTPGISAAPAEERLGFGRHGMFRRLEVRYRSL
jgi:hypothetical protein